MLGKSTTASIRARVLLASRSEAGFTLIEMLVSALIIVLIGAAVAESLIATAYISGDQRRHSQAAEIAQQDQERLRGLSVAQLNSLNQVAPRTATVGGVPYTVTSTSHFLNNTGGPSCEPGAAAYFKIDSSVDWASNKRGPVVIESIIAPPAGGTIRAQVHDQTDAPLANVAVTGDGPDTEVAPTDENGCAVLSGLPAGSYNVSYALFGYVDPNGYSSTPGVTASVTSTGNAIPSTDPVKLGPAGTVTGTFQAWVGSATSGTVTDGGEADALSWYGAGASMSMTDSKSAPSTPGSLLTSISSTALFPFAFTGPSYTNNYQVWAGRCRQQQPPAGYNRVTVAPASTPTMNVLEPELDLIVKNGSTQIKPSQVKITFQSTSGPNCGYTWKPTIASDAATSAYGALANRGVPFATDTANVSASTYTGTMTICADNGSRRRTITGVVDSYTAVTTQTLDISNAGGGTSGTCP